VNNSRFKFKIAYTNDDGVVLVSVNFFSIQDLASYNEHEWEFTNGECLPSNDIEPNENNINEGK